MADRIFYVAAQDLSNLGKINGYVPSKFLARNGSYVMDPMSGGSQDAYFYADSAGSNKTNGKIANPRNYVVVPETYHEQDAQRFADVLAAARRDGVFPALGLMANAFWPGGSEELQRNQRWGIPSNSFVPAYISAASDHFGYITGAAGLPQDWAENGGGLHNLYSWSRGQFSKQNGAHPIDISGSHFLSPQNAANIAQGYAAGVAARKPSMPFNDYAQDAQRQPTSEQIGDGSGIAGFSASLAGVDPDEPAPPTWPPLAEQPIRYLSSRRVRY